MANYTLWLRTKAKGDKPTSSKTTNQTQKVASSANLSTKQHMAVLIKCEQLFVKVAWFLDFEGTFKHKL